MHEILQPALNQLLQGQDLDSSTVADCIGAVMDGECEAVDIAAWLTAMTCKGPTPDEVVGAARAMRERASGVVTSRQPLLDTCGTGGDCLHTFNISTVTAIVAAAAGVNVAKHGNRSVSSSSGSADVLEKLGVNIQITPEQAGRCLDEIGIAFCFAPMAHGAMKHAASVRRSLGFPTIFNLLGPLTNPASAGYQLLGASSVERASLLANALSRLGGRRAFVVCGNDELDEVCLWGPTTVFDVSDEVVTKRQWTPDDFGLPSIDVSDLKVSSSNQSAEMIRAVLNNDSKSSAAIAIVTANSAAALMVAEVCDSLTEAVSTVQSLIRSGAAAEKLQELAEITQAYSKA